MRNSKGFTIVILLATLLLLLLPPCCVRGFHHNHCNNRKVKPQFQLEDCYVPPLDTSLLLSQASFLMSHDSATGYIKPYSPSQSGVTWRYSKNQVGTAYQQLDDGARALDLRPKLLQNGTVIFQHGAINLPIRLETLVQDAVKWTTDNPDELVLLLASDFAYQSKSNNYKDDDDFDVQEDGDTPAIVSAMNTIYQKFSVPYYPCNQVYDMTIAEIIEMAALPTGGYLLALDGQDYYGTPCAKPNWVESQLVGCYSTSQNPNYESNKTISCTRHNSEKLQALQSYMLASSNNEATDSKYVLGPPANAWPLNEIQAFWQVTSTSAVIGLSQWSSILDDNRQSNLNAEVMEMIHSAEKFRAISILAVDNVALHGNALLSVLRTACGQSSELGQDECGPQLSKPRLSYLHFFSKDVAYVMLVVLYALIGLWFVLTLAVAIRDHPHPRLFLTLFQRLEDKHCGQTSDTLVESEGGSSFDQDGDCRQAQ